MKFQKDEFAKKRAKKRQRANSEKVKNHQIVHSAFQIAFRDQSQGSNSNSVLPNKKDRRSRGGSDRRGRSRSRRRRDISHESNEIPLNRDTSFETPLNLQPYHDINEYRTEPSEATPHLVRHH